MYRLGASPEWTPLLLNLAFACLTVLVVYYAGNRRGWPNYWKVVVSLAVVIWCPLFANVFAGMEHTLQILITMLLFTFAGEYLAAGKANSARLPWHLMWLAALAAAARYEDCFLVFSICLLLAIQRRWLPALCIAAAGAAPIAIYAVFALSHGGMWAPGSVLVKAWGVSRIHALAKYTLVGAALFNLLLIGPYMIPLIVTTTFLYFIERPWKRAAWSQETGGGQWSDGAYLFPVWILTTLLHLDLASIGWYYRYEAYLLAMGLFTLGALIAPRLPQRLSWPTFPKASPLTVSLAILALLLVGCMTARAGKALFTTPTASCNIQQQQYQVARFLGENYPAETVALNDIGAVAFFTNVPIDDLCGLATIEASREILHHTYDTKAIDTISKEKRAEAAVSYSCGFFRLEDLEKLWKPVATWTISNNVACAASTITFFATRPENEEALRTKLLAFAPKLPPDVKVEMLPNSPRSAAAP
jgi:hypothetical protein